MLCDDCCRLVQHADHEFHSSDSPTPIKQEVSTTKLLSAVASKCYLCTRLHIELGDQKWNHLSSHFSRTNLVSFDKSAHCHVPNNNILLRLGCKLTPFSGETDAHGEPILGSSYSYGYLQVALLPRNIESLAVPSPAVASKYAISTSDSAVLSLIQHWLNTCSTSPDHELCHRQSDQAKTYPTRLIDVGPEGLSPDFWRLVEVQTEAITGPFVTLSHRWGSGAIKLERSTQHKMLSGMPLSVLPGTYQDAIQVVKHLGVRYLWIDSICIFQDERSDIQNEATRMAEVYGNAICNIAALSGKDDGLFCDRSPETMNSDSVILDQDIFRLNTSYLINDLQLWRGELIHMPLTTRGWVLQEEVLAPRTIYFGSRQVLWNCLPFRACETYPSMQPKRSVKMEKSSTDKETFLHDEELEPITSWLSLVKTHSDQAISRGFALDEVDRKILYKVWTDFVAHYSLRQLTFTVDKLLAIAGVSKLFGTVMRDDFIAGLWRQHLMEGLLWYIRVNTRSTTPSEYRAPTWSWASKDGYVIHAEPFNTSWIVARALNVRCNVIANDTTAPPQQFGMVASGTMTLQAPLIQIRVDEHGNWSGFTETFTAKFAGKHQVPQLTVRVDTSDIIPPGEEYIGAIIRTTAYRLTDAPSSYVGKKIHLAAQGIVLKGTGKLAREENSSGAQIFSYTRIGYFALEDRRSRNLTPMWAPLAEGSSIFPLPVKQADMGEFAFDDATTALSVMEIL